MTNKYVRGNEFLDFSCKAGDSYISKGIIKAQNRLKEGFRVRIGDGSGTRLWFDPWVGDTPLIGDVMTWKLEANGKYTAKSRYRFFMDGYSLPPPTIDWKKLWKLECPEHMKFFIWLVLNESLPTNSLRARRGMSASNICRRCNMVEETCIHCLRDCPVAKHTWVHFDFGTVPNFFTMDPANWLLNLFHRDIEYEFTFIKEVFLNNPSFSAKTGITVKWGKPRPGLLKLNTDGSSLGNPGPAGFGGLFRDENGRWICGFSSHLGNRTNMFAELSAIKHGLNIAINRGFLRFVVDADCLEAINLIMEGDISTHHLGVIISDIRMLRSRFEVISFNHVFREVNHCVDALAKLGTSSNENLCVWENPPPVISLGLMADLAATSFCRL
ncbi:reverse transcriptase [Senna tora]|uniref:Reverse transcriptase n=1 Tax=Senna tora TaxID=362788 RepID=A0A834TU72_9FABA|nr:reverse transcriptase [Senna tora]